MVNPRDSRSSLRRFLLALACLGVTGAAVAGCGDGPICQSEVMVAIKTPHGVILEDSNVDMAGVQVPVSVSSTVGAGVDVVLTVLDETDTEISTVTATTDADGNATFDDVTVPSGTVKLHVLADTGDCGSDEDEVIIEVAAGSGCELAVREGPLANVFYAPLGVLNLSNDSDPGQPDFQVHLDVTTSAAYDVELFVTDGTGVETSVETATADGSGLATLALSLTQGRHALRAVCSDASGTLSRPSLTTTVFVDTVAPTCGMTMPAAGATITPGMDADNDLGNGIQLTLAAHADGGDVEGEPVTFEVTVDGTTVTIPGSALDAAGDSSAPATIDPASTPSTATVALSSNDHAGNGCEVSDAHDVVYNGCDIAVVSPTATVTTDADGNVANGVQVDIGLQVATACAGRTVTSTCGLDNPSGTVIGDGTLTLRADWCGSSPCDVQQACTFSVTAPSGITTSAGASIHYDDQPPAVGIQIFDPAVACGGQVTPSADIDGATPGVQVSVRVIAPSADRKLRETNSGGTQTLDANTSNGAVVVTILPGLNSFVGIATDSVGNSAETPACTLMLADIVVAFSPPAADGMVSAADGVVSGSNLTFTLSGTVSNASATVTVSVDGGAGVLATVVGNTWSVPLTLAASPPSHAIVATATAPGPLLGTGNLTLTVDLTAPTSISDLAVIADTRQSLKATWSAPSDGGGAAASYIVKVSTVALTNLNFDSTGQQVTAGAPRTPGLAELLRITPVRTGTAFWVGVAAVDAAGNRAPAAIVGPVTPRFDQTAAIVPPDTGAIGTFAGAALAFGKFNNDELWDIAVAAPTVDVGATSGAGEVFVYFGSATGIHATPDVVIKGATADGNFGTALTTVRWSSATRDDLVVGEPYSHNADGRVYVYNGGASFTAGTRTVADASLQIGVNSASNYFTGGVLGWSLAALDFDGDGHMDLAVDDPLGGGGNGAVAIVYGGSFTGSTILLSDVSTAQLGGAVVHLIADPDTTTFDIFGSRIFDVGRTFGAADTTDDLVISYADGVPKAFVYRGGTTRPSATGVYARGFTTDQDVRIDFAAATAVNEFGSAAGSIADLNGDGARDLVIGAYRQSSNAGTLLIIDGNTVGTGGVASTASAGVVITTITAGAGSSFVGSNVVNNATSPGSDVDGDGVEDLIVTDRVGGIARLLVWFGGSIPTGATTTASANHVITGPSTFNGGVPNTGGSPYSATWAGDVNGDGLSDICWADQTGNGLVGSMQVLWDDGL